MIVNSKNLENNENMYPGFVQGSDTDKDVIARACGLKKDHIMCSLEALLQDNSGVSYKLVMEFATEGDQKISEIEDDEIEDLAKKTNYSVDEVEDILSDARKGKLSLESKVKIFAAIVKEAMGTDLFSLNCWYEGNLVLSKKESESSNWEKVREGYESDLGLDGVYGSIQDIHDAYKDDDRIVELVEWLLEED